MTKEMIFHTHKGLDQVLQELNKVFLYADAYVREPEGSLKKNNKFKKALEGFLDRVGFIEKRKKDKKIDDDTADKAVLDAFFNMCASRHRYASTSARTLFKEGRGLLPTEGDGKEGKAFANKNLIIGVDFDMPDYKFRMKYRVDFDPFTEPNPHQKRQNPGKGLHINFNLWINGQEYVYALQVTCDSKRYYVSPPHKIEDKKLSKKEREAQELAQIDIQHELIKFKYFIKMTLGYLMKYPQKLGKLMHDAGSDDIFYVSGRDIEREKSIISFLQRDRFHFDTLIGIFTDYIPESSESIRACSNPQELLQLLDAHSTLRHAFVELAIQTYTKFRLILTSIEENSEETSKTLCSEDTSEESKNHRKPRKH